MIPFWLRSMLIGSLPQWISVVKSVSGSVAAVRPAPFLSIPSMCLQLGLGHIKEMSGQIAVVQQLVGGLDHQLQQTAFLPTLLPQSSRISNGWSFQRSNSFVTISDGWCVEMAASPYHANKFSRLDRTETFSTRKPKARGNGYPSC